jgi:hypothetical protein
MENSTTAKAAAMPNTFLLNVTGVVRNFTSKWYCATILVVSVKKELNFEALAWLPGSGENLTTAAFAFPAILSLRPRDRLPLQVRNRIGSAAGERDNMVLHVAGAWAGRAARRWARMLQLELVLHL